MDPCDCLKISFWNTYDWPGKVVTKKGPNVDNDDDITMTTITMALDYNGNDCGDIDYDDIDYVDINH